MHQSLIISYQNKKSPRNKYLYSQTVIMNQNRQLSMLQEEQILLKLNVNEGLEFKKELQDLRRLPIVLHAKQLEIQGLLHKLQISDRTMNALSTDLEGCIVRNCFLSQELDMERKQNMELKLNVAEMQSEGNIISCLFLFIILSDFNVFLIVLRKEMQCNDLDNKIKQLTQTEENLQIKTIELTKIQQEYDNLQVTNTKNVSISHHQQGNSRP